MLSQLRSAGLRAPMAGWACPGRLFRWPIARQPPRGGIRSSGMDSIPEAGDDASHAEWIDLNILEAEQVAGDHFSIIEELRK